MGAGSSIYTSRSIFLEVDGNIEKIVFSLHCSTKEVHDLICQLAKVSRHSNIALRASDGAYITLSPAMPLNTPRDPYIVEIRSPEDLDLETSSSTLPVLEQLTAHLTGALRTEQGIADLVERIKSLELKMEVEGLKSVEIDKCKKGIDSIKCQIFEAQKKFVDYNRLRPIYDGVGITYHSSNCEKVSSVRREIPSYPKYTLSPETIAYLKQPTFDIWHWEPNEMLSLLEHMYLELGLVKEFNINGVTLKKWLLCIQENYRNNPFHNFRHCFCVTQMMYGLVHLCKLNEKISKEDIGVLLTACICHDLDHPGYNNTYQINARTELAIRYNDISPLENHHCSVAFQILADPETNIFANCDPERFKRIRQAIITLILATDMAQHAEIMENFKERLENFDNADSDDLKSLKMVLIKCCDISNEVRPMEVSEPWLDCLLEEYFNQSDKEKAQGLPVASFMDRDTVTKPTAQIGFIKFVLLPMFEQVAKLFPQMSVIVDPLRKAKEHWENLKKQDDMRKSAQQNIPSLAS